MRSWFVIVYESTRPAFLVVCLLLTNLLVGSLSGMTGDSASGPLVFEHFEWKTEGIATGVDFTNEVVGFGGTPWPNASAGKFDTAGNSAVGHESSRKVTSSDFTVEAFVKPTNTSIAIAAIASDWDDRDANRSWAFVMLADGALRFDVSPDGRFQPGNTIVTGRRWVRPNEWSHVAAVSRGDTSRIYVNGVLVAESKRSVPGIMTTHEANLMIGNVKAFSGQPRPFSGLLDEVRITQRALNPSEFLATKEPMPKPAGPLPEKFEMPFVAQTKGEAEAWQRRARARLLELVEACEPRVSLDEVPLDPHFDPPEDRGDYLLYSGSFRANGRDEVRRPIYLTIPKGKGPFPAMLCLHGHGGSRDVVFDPKNVYHGFADRFARGGYVVLAPSFPHKEYAALMLWDLFRCVDLLESREEVDPKRIGVAGLSMGGEWTMLAAACDTRLRAAVVSGWMCTSEGVFSVPNCPCWELPGLVELMDICEVHLLIAPRPVLFESAEHDPCFPIRHVKEGFARIREGYRVFGVEAAAGQDVWPAGHEWHGDKAWPFVDQVLGGRSTDVMPKSPPRD